MVVRIDEYREAEAVRDHQIRCPTDANTPAAATVSNVFRFRHPFEAYLAPATEEGEYADLADDLDRVCALAAQS